jgi:Fur family peroxide stress response transcriptional regulator
MNNLEFQLDSFIIKCKETGLSVTPQRISIYKALLANNLHPSPDMVYAEIKKENPTISFATVYKTLETFEKQGFIKKVTPLHNTVRYDTITEKHQHLVCVKCGKITDIEIDELSCINLDPKVLQNNLLLDYNIDFNVICEECQKKLNN